ncbi:MAG: hypothetical protein ACLUDZ_05285, partial [Roseburia intestinalis]
AEDFTPCFAEQNASPLVSRGFYSLFCGAKCEPFGEQCPALLARILLLCFTTFYFILLYATLSYLVVYVNHLSYI